MQLKYGKEYDFIENRVRKTIYFIRKDAINGHNKLYEKGFVFFKRYIDMYTDYLRDEMPLALYALPSKEANSFDHPIYNEIDLD